MFTLLLNASIRVFRCVYWFFVAAITNDHKLSVLNNTNSFSYSSGSQKSELNLTGLMSNCGQARLRPLLETCLFQPLEVTYFPWLVTLSPFQG
jgi:hypothetical protein